MSAYLDSSRPFPYCGGCGHPHVLRALDEALGRLEIDPSRLALVTDIGCVGLADPFFPGLHTVHTLHGRSVAVAAGLAMGVRREDSRPLKPVVLIGDGGVGIGLLHVVHAAQLNVDVTVVVHNNFIYGMTGGQHSVLTPPGLKTTTTPRGAIIPPLDLGAVLQGAGAGFFARTVAPSEELAPTLAEALRHPGFACVEVFELCPTFTGIRGGMTGKDVKEIPQRLGQALGVLRRDQGRPAFPAGPGARAESGGGGSEGSAEPEGVEPVSGLAALDRTVRLVVAGRAGERVQSAALLAARAAMCAGLQATVRTDNPVTQGSGFSLAELVLSPEPVTFTGMVAPDLVIATAAEGYRELEARGLLQAPGAGRRTVLDLELPDPKGVRADKLPLRRSYGGKGAALGGLVAEISRAGWWPRRAWDLALGELDPGRQADTRAILDRAS